MDSIDMDKIIREQFANKPNVPDNDISRVIVPRPNNEVERYQGEQKISLISKLMNKFSGFQDDSFCLVTFPDKPQEIDRESLYKLMDILKENKISVKVTIAYKSTPKDN